MTPKASATRAWRRATADVRARPDFVIVGAQRGGTTSLFTWLGAHPDVRLPLKKEIHYFDVHYDRGPRWYRSHFPVTRGSRVTGEASPYMLYHPLAPGRAARDLPDDTRFIVLLREPVQRTISHYWFSRQFTRWEVEPLERAIALEPERLEGQVERVMNGERSFAHSTYSYVARSEYVGQVRAWFEAVGRDRVLVVESEQLYTQPQASEAVAEWLGLAPHRLAYPNKNKYERFDIESAEVVTRLREHFEPLNRELFDLLGRELWTSGA
jgi:hypothetical protein